MSAQKSRYDTNTGRGRRMWAMGICSSIALAAAGYAQQGPARGGPPAGGPGSAQNPQDKGRGQGGGRSIPALNETGFTPIFDGKSLAGWDGDPQFWRVQDGAIIGQTAADKQPKQNTFLIWRGGSPADFELKLQYRLTGHNSGIQIRSAELPNVKWAMTGYQADMDAAQQYTGQFYEERGRGFLAMRGQFTYIGQGQRPGLVASLGDGAELKSLIQGDDWNELHLMARGNTLVQLLNEIGRAHV